LISILDRQHLAAAINRLELFGPLMRLAIAVGCGITGYHHSAVAIGLGLGSMMDATWSEQYRPSARQGGADGSIFVSIGE
jgi:hypothetical protein